MIKQASKIFAVLTVFLFVQTGCSMIRVSQEESRPGTVVNELIKTTKSWDGKSLPAYLQGQPQITILRITIPPGTRLDTHSHPVINVGVLISGELTVVSEEGKKLHLKEGDPIVELVNTLHYGVNEGNVPAEIIVFYAGVTDSAITVY